MNVYIIDQHPIYILGLKKYLIQLNSMDAKIETCQTTDIIEFEKVNNTDWLFVNIEMFTSDFSKRMEEIVSRNSRIKLLGLVDTENLEILKHVNASIFNAIMVREGLVGELKSLNKDLSENNKYYSPGIVSFINSLPYVVSHTVNYK